MTEYDYSPEAHQRHLQTQDRIAKWVDQTDQELSRSRSQPYTPSSSSSNRRVDHRRRSESHNPSTRYPLPPHHPVFQPSYHSPSTIMPGHSISSAPSPQARSMSVPRQHRPPSLYALPGPTPYQAHPAMYGMHGLTAPVPQNTHPYLRHPPPVTQNISPAHSHRSQPSNSHSYHIPTRSSSPVAYPGPGSTSYERRSSKSPVVISSAGGGSYVIIPPRGKKVDIVYPSGRDQPARSLSVPAPQAIYPLTRPPQPAVIVFNHSRRDRSRKEQGVDE